MEMFPLRFCKPVYFGVPPSREHPVAVNNGTASLLDLRGDLLAITCHHVIEGYRRKLAEDRRCLFAIGNCYFDPLAQLVAEDGAIDVAVLRLSAPGPVSELPARSTLSITQEILKPCSRTFCRMNATATGEQVRCYHQSRQTNLYAKFRF